MQSRWRQRSPCGWMIKKTGTRSTTPWLPQWAAASLLLYLALATLQPFIGPHPQFLFLYLVPVLIAAQGGIGPGLAMLVAAGGTYVALESLLLGESRPEVLATGLLLYLTVGGLLASRVAADRRLVERYRRESEATRELLRFARHTGDPTAQPLLLRAVADVGARLLRADYGATFLWDPRSKQFRAAQQSAAAETAGVRFSSLALPAAGSPVVAQLARGRGALTTADAGASADWARLVHGLPVCRVLLVPAFSWGRVLGCLLFGRDRGAPPFSERDRRLAEAMAEQVATSLEHAESFRALEQQADQIRRLNHDLEQQNSRLMELEQLRNDLVSMIVHDMRAPLTSVIASMRWVERGAGDTLKAPLAEAHQIGRRSAEELLGMVNDLLDVARSEEGRLELHRTRVTAADLAAAALEQTWYLAEERRLKIETDIPASLPAVCVDRNKVVRVLVNLIGNAIKFTPVEGRIVIAARPQDSHQISMSVEDDGEGIPPEFHEHIFDKFGQVATRQGGRKMSTGLGLAYCRMAVEAHGGMIGVESRPGEGARFTFTLPSAANGTSAGGGDLAA
jgi:signal transduction histidine kinase